MYKLCKTDRSARRQWELEQGLLEAMKTQRYEDISVSDLCQRMGIPRKCFYRYFDSKDGALHALIDHTLMEFWDWGDSLYAGSTREGLELFFRFWKENRGLLDALESSGLSRILAERAVDFSSSDALIMGHLLPGGEGDGARHIAAFWVWGMMAMMLSWYREGFPESPARMAEVAARALDRAAIVTPASCFPQKR